ncbi:ABC transporter transmembrane domain type 1 [Penicillium verhagenii]|nr:ABC transporter transmembrane domain type 1 [Penicillium verhagenii]
MQIIVLSWVEDERSVRPSSLLAIYLLFTLLFDVVQTRSLWLSHRDLLITILFTTGVATKTAMLLFESLGKQKHLIGSYQDFPPESTSGIVNRSFMWWLNRLFSMGFRSLLTAEDLDRLDKPLESAETARKALRAWTLRRHPERRFEFPLQMGRAFKGPLAWMALPRIFLIGFTFSQPFLIASVLNWLDNSHSASNLGYGLIGATLLIYLGMALSNLIYDQMLYRLVTMFRGAASSMIYDHALRIPDGTLGDRSATVTLMTTDVDRIIASLITLNEYWARTIEVGIGIALLALRLGWVCLMPLIVVLISSGGSIYISKHIGGHQKVWVDAVQQRISITRSLLDSIQTIKATGLSQTFLRLVQRKRTEETRQMATYRWSVVWKNMIQNLPWALAPALTFAVYAAQGNELNATKAFSSLSIITLLTNPASKLLSAIPSIAASSGSFDRIQAFLLLDTSPQHTTEGLCQTTESEVDASPHVAEMQNMSFQGPPDTTGLRTPVISMKNLSIRPFSSAKIVLRDVNLEVPLGALVIVKGPVGSGKSTLLRTILGQAICETGSMAVTIRNPAFCAQSPWLPIGTIRDIICGSLSAAPTTESAFDKKWYEAVLHACDLSTDLAFLREGDATRVGHGSGHILSGGQMHRIALARAVYVRKKLLLLDDIFSALDRKTKGKIISRLLGADGLLRKTKSTVILVTHENGCLSQEEPCVGNVYQEIKSDAVEAEEVKEFSELAIEDKAALISKANKIDDLRRAAGDSAVYAYYLRYVGWTNAKFGFSDGLIVVEVKKALYVSVYFFLAICNTVGNGGYGHSYFDLTLNSASASLCRAEDCHDVYSILFLAHHSIADTSRATPQFLVTVDIGSILNRFSQDMTLIESDLPVGILITISSKTPPFNLWKYFPITISCYVLILWLIDVDLFSSIANAALIATGSKYMAISVPFLILSLFLLQHFYLKTSRQLRLLDLESRDPLYSHLHDTIEGLSTIQAFGWEADFRIANLKLLDATQRTYYMLHCIQRWLTLVLDLIVAAEAVIVVSLAVSLRHTTSVGLLGVSLNSILGIYSQWKLCFPILSLENRDSYMITQLTFLRAAFNGSLSSLISGWTQLEISLGSILRVKDFELQVPREVSTGVEVPVDWPSQGAIELSDMTAQYSSGIPVLSSVSLKVLPGQKIGIYGRTGSGKSSLLSSLLGMLSLIRGSIFIDDIDLTTVSPELVRERLVAISQKPFIMTGCTVRFNLDPTGVLPDEEIIAALDRVGIWDGVLFERGGLDAEINDTTSLSRGEQQLLQFARAMLKIQACNASILLIDEGTSSVDTETDARVQGLLQQDPFRACTVLTVAHRVHTLLSYDLVVGLDRGNVVEMDKPAVLSNRKDSIFSNLINSGR